MPPERGVGQHDGAAWSWRAARVTRITRDHLEGMAEEIEGPLREVRAAL